VVRIDYHPTSVTATVVASTTTTLSSSATNSLTNQPVTLTAEVTAGSGSETPTGTVEFDNHGTAIPGCRAQPLDPAGVATCGTSFVAGLSPQRVTAAFHPAAGADFASSTSDPPTPVSVEQDRTTTALSDSDPAPDPGQSVTLTAAVTPDHAGPAQPSGAMRFLDDGEPLPTCSELPLEPGATASTATCTVNLPTAGSHRLTATYSGDADFTGSTSSAQTVTVTVTALAPGQPAQAAPQDRQACSEIRATATTYRPTTAVSGAVVPGLRTRLSVATPAELQVHARVAFRRGGKTHIVDLGRHRLRVRDWRNLRLPLPRPLRSLLPLGQKATLLLEIRTSPHDPGECPASPTTVRKRLGLRVVNVSPR
jgi:hypothetical protein